MVTRLERLLFVCAMFFVTVTTAFSAELLSYVRIIIEFNVSGTNINFICTDFWSPYLMQIGAEIHVSVADVDSDVLFT